MAPDLRLVIQLQGLDTRIGELKNEISALPKHIAAIEKTLESQLRKLEAGRAALAANQKERKKLEGDIQAENQKISRFRDQMQGSKITNEQYRAFLLEIEHCEKVIRKAEDRILELMTESEPLENNLAAVDAALTVEKAKVAAEAQQARERTAADKKALEELLKERKALAAGVSARVYTAYERVRKRNNGLAVAEATDGHCSACHIALRPQFFQDLKMGDEVMFCESCRRILYYNPPAEVVDDAPPASPEAVATPPGQ